MRKSRSVASRTYRFSCCNDPIIDTLMPKYLNGAFGFRYSGHPPWILSPPTHIACLVLKLYPEISDFRRFTATPVHVEKELTQSMSTCI